MRKQHTYRLDTFDGGDAGPLALIEDGRVRVLRARPPATDATGLVRVCREPRNWPRVEIVLNYVGASGAVVDAMVAQGIAGVVVAGTGNGTVGAGLHAALCNANATGVRVVRASRCANGAVIGGDDAELPGAGALTAVQARVELILRLLQQPV